MGHLIRIPVALPNVNEVKLQFFFLTQPVRSEAERHPQIRTIPPSVVKGGEVWRFGNKGETDRGYADNLPLTAILGVAD